MCSISLPSSSCILITGTYGMAAPWYFPILPSYWKERFGCTEVKREKSNGLMFTNIMMQNTNPSANKTSKSIACIIIKETAPKAAWLVGLITFF